VKIGTAIAIYFVIWWIVLFAILPWGVKNPHEAGETILDGNEPGAPVKHQMGKKAFITTVVSAIVFAIIYLAIRYGWSSMIDPK
jgi:predicted secreted protein